MTFVVSTTNRHYSDRELQAIFIPPPQVCENDILVVDVINRLPGKAAAMHWRGQTQVEMPYMDGAPLITQCPISSYTTFQYKFRASTPGTHLWHAHAGDYR